MNPSTPLCEEVLNQSKNAGQNPNDQDIQPDKIQNNKHKGLNHKFRTYKKFQKIKQLKH